MTLPPRKRAKSAQCSPSPGILPGFPNPVAGLLRHSITASDVRVGVLAVSYPTSLWYLGMAGKPVWVVSGKEVPARVDSDPPWYSPAVCPSDLEGVDVLVIQGRWPSRTSRWWADTGAKLIIRVSPWSERGRRKFPKHWDIFNDLVRHDETGGVTNGLFRRWWALPKGSNTLNVKKPKGLNNVLSQVLKPTVRGNRWCDIPPPGEPNSARGLLDWDAIDARVKSPSVFRRDKWLLRELTEKERENILDFPETRGALLSTEVRNALLDVEIPGKLWVAGLSVIELWNTSSSGSSKRKRHPQEEIELPDDGSHNMRAREATSSSSWSHEEFGEEPMGSALQEVRMHLNLKAKNEGLPALPEGSTVTEKAVKADSAAVPVHLWDNRVAAVLQSRWQQKGVKAPPLALGTAEGRASLHRILNNVRKRLLNVWKRRVRRSFFAWYAGLSATIEDRVTIRSEGLKACQKAQEASWWEWDRGSAIFFWRWPTFYQEAARRGVAPFYDTDPPSNRDEQPPYSDESVRLMVKEKLAKVLKKSYIELCDIEDIEAMMYMFHVPKGTDDIRMVYDGSKSGLNNSLWAPWFALPNIDTMARWVVAGSWLADNDYGEQFLNFPLHPDLQKYCGVDLTQLFPEWKDPNFRLLLGRWTRNAMGLKPSPYNSVQGALVAKYVIMGHPKEVENPFSWDRIVLNLPGSSKYNPTLPWIMKIRKDGLLASGLVQYIDDLRTMAATRELAWNCSSTMAKGLSYLGLQDAARKRRECTQTPGAWAGAVVSTEDGLFKSVTQERWLKTQGKIRRLGLALGLSDQHSDLCETDSAPPLAHQGVDGRVWIHFKSLERITGFLVYVGMTYKMMVPYIKGLHLTLNSWRPNRDEEGWKVKPPRASVPHGDPPEYVRPVPRFEGDVAALMQLTAFEDPPKIPVRALNDKPWFVVGDASGSGFGVSSWQQGSGVIRVTHGNWSEQVTSEASSNFREAANLAMELERLVRSGVIRAGTELWVFTDNSCAEKTFYKGSSSSPLLHAMVLGLRKLEMEGALIIHFVWISGNRMIAQGTDGLSRGDFTSGVMAGQDYLKFIPINESALERELSLGDTLQSWGLGEWKLSSPTDWFYNARTQRDVGWIWAPAPSLARVALDELCETRHMFPYTSHIFVCPALMTGYWRKDLGKLADIMFTVEAGSVIWGKAQFEPLTIAFVCPLLPRFPWAVARLSSLDAWKRNLPALFQGDQAVIRGHMRKLWSAVASGKAMQDLDDTLVDPGDCGDEDELRFQIARDGDHLITPFQCVDCHFVNIKGRFPDEENHKDALATTAITRAILDSLWSRESTTVASNRREGIRYLSELALLGFQENAYPPRGPFPKADIWGMSVACALLGRSMAKGRNTASVQFETVRKLRSHYASLTHTCADFSGEGTLHVVDRGFEALLSNAPTNSLWFKRFMTGCHRRMGDVWLPDRPLTAPIFRQCIRALENRWHQSASDKLGRLKIGLTACMLLSGYYGALRGEEIVRVDAGLMLKHWEEALQHEEPHVPLMLTGRFKQTVGAKIFCQPLAIETQAGMPIGAWFQRLLDIYESNGIRTGPLFRDAAVKRASVAELDVWFRGVLKHVQDRFPNLISDDADLEQFSMRRSARRGATSEAQNSGIPDYIIEANNRWRKRFRAKGLNPRMSMLERYTDAQANVKHLVQFSLLLRH